MQDLLIGITTDFAPAEPGRDDRYFLKSSYVRYFRDGGARVVLLPFSDSFSPDDWTFLDGLVLSGSGPDIPPHFYGDSQKFFPGSWMNEERIAFEFGLLDLSELARLPIFGICGGFQTMNVYRGGTLIQDLLTLHQSSVSHQDSQHDVEIRLPWPEGSSPQTKTVNSFHHQGIDRLGSNLDVMATSPEDRLVEGFFDPGHPFFAGVQWHPERMSLEDPLSRSLRDSFLKACMTRKRSGS